MPEGQRGQRRRRTHVIPAKAGISPPILPLWGRCPAGAERAIPPSHTSGEGRRVSGGERSVIPAEAGISPPILPLWGRCPKGREGSAAGALRHSCEGRNLAPYSPPLGRCPKAERAARDSARVGSEHVFRPPPPKTGEGWGEGCDICPLPGRDPDSYPVLMERAACSLNPRIPGGAPVAKCRITVAKCRITVAKCRICCRKMSHHCRKASHRCRTRNPQFTSESPRKTGEMRHSAKNPPPPGSGAEPQRRESRPILPPWGRCPQGREGSASEASASHPPPEGEGRA